MQTGYYTGSATTSDVFIILIGSQGVSPPKKLHDTRGNCFCKGETDVFIMAFPYGFGMINEIQVWHNNTGDSPGWFFLQAQVCGYWIKLLVGPHTTWVIAKLVPRHKDEWDHFRKIPLFHVKTKNNFPGRRIPHRTVYVRLFVLERYSELQFHLNPDVVFFPRKSGQGVNWSPLSPFPRAHWHACSSKKLLKIIK